MLLLGNPLSLTGEFYDSHHGKSPLYERVSISAYDSPNVIEGRLDALPGLVTPEDIEEHRLDWGADSPLYITSVLGQFPEALEDSLTSRVHVDAAIQRWRREAGDSLLPSAGDLKNPRPSAGGERERSDARGGAEPLISPSDGPHLNMPWRMGVDVARFGNDKSVICLRRGDRVERIISFERKDTMRLADEVREIAETLRIPAVFVDETGGGGGVVDRLKQLRVPVIGVEGGGKAYRPAQFADMRAEVFWEVARRLREGQMSLPPDDELAGQLLAQRYDISSSGAHPPRKQGDAPPPRRPLPRQGRRPSPRLHGTPQHERMVLIPPESLPRLRGRLGEGRPTVIPAPPSVIPAKAGTSQRRDSAAIPPPGAQAGIQESTEGLS